MRGRAALGELTPSGVPANGASREPDISEDGKLLAFTSEATDLAPDTLGTSAGSKWNVFVQDTESGEIALVSRGAEPANGHSRGARISGNGRFIAFQSEADNLVAGDDNGVSDVFVAKNPFSP